MMALMAYYTAESFRANCRNTAGLPATGLLQWLPGEAMAMGIMLEDLALSTAAQQLEYAHKYFSPMRGRLKTLDDLYMARIWPRAIGTKPGNVLFSKFDVSTRKYVASLGLSYNEEGCITKADVCKSIWAKYDKGMSPELKYIPGE